MKNLTAKAAIDKINSHAQNINEFENLKIKYELEYKNKLAEINNIEKEEEEKILSLQKTIVPAQLSDILTLLAVRWETFLSSLKATCSTRFDFDLFDYEAIDIINFTEDIKTSLPLITQNIPVTITIEDKTRPNKKVILPEVEIPLDSIQPDGKTLLEHINPKFSSPRIGKGRIEIKFDNYKNLILPFPVNRLCRFNGTNYEPSTPITEVVLKASQLYYNSKNDNQKEMF